VITPGRPTGGPSSHVAGTARELEGGIDLRLDSNSALRAARALLNEENGSGIKRSGGGASGSATHRIGAVAVMTIRTVGALSAGASLFARTARLEENAFATRDDITSVEMDDGPSRRRVLHIPGRGGWTAWAAKTRRSRHRCEGKSTPTSSRACREGASGKGYSGARSHWWCSLFTPRLVKNRKGRRVGGGRQITHWTSLGTRSRTEERSCQRDMRRNS
jgi:hypothetical protein